MSACAVRWLRWRIWWIWHTCANFGVDLWLVLPRWKIKVKNGESRTHYSLSHWIELNSLFRSLRLNSRRVFLYNLYNWVKIVFHWSILFIYYFMVSIIFDNITITSKIILALITSHAHTSHTEALMLWYWIYKAPSFDIAGVDWSTCSNNVGTYHYIRIYFMLILILIAIKHNDPQSTST